MRTGRFRTFVKHHSTVEKYMAIEINPGWCSEIDGRG
jgi:hypothetical protein